MIDIKYETKFLVRLNPQRLVRVDEDNIFPHFYTRVMMDGLRTGEDMTAVWSPIKEELRESL